MAGASVRRPPPVNQPCQSGLALSSLKRRISGRASSILQPTSRPLPIRDRPRPPRLPRRSNSMKLGLQIPRSPGRVAPRRSARRSGASRARPTTSGFDSIWVMDHFFQIRGVGPAEEPMLEGWTALGFLAAQTTSGAARADGRRRPLPPAGPVGQGRDDARRPVRRPRLARDRGRLEPGGVRGARVPVPAARRALRDARGDAPDRPRDVDGRARHRGGVPRPPVPGRAGC